MYLISLEEGKTAVELEEAKVIISGDKMADNAKDKMADPVENEKAAIREEKAKNTQRIRVMIFLSVCYSANTGGSGTLTGKKVKTTTKKNVLFTFIFSIRLFPIGTGPNLVLKGMLYTLFGNNTPVNFATWMGFAMPIVLGTS
jgi:hypothetical protein